MSIDSRILYVGITNICGNLWESRGKNRNILLQKVRTAAGRKSFLSQGSKLYDKLPDASTQEQSIMNSRDNEFQLDSEF